MMTPRFALAAVLAVVCTAGVRAEIIQPRGDLTMIRTAAGQVAMLRTMTPVRMARDIQTLSFFKRSTDGPAEQIPFDFGRGYEPLLHLRGGADCMLAGARVLRDGGRLHVVYARRKGEWFDKQPVTFELFELTEDDSDAPHTTPLYFSLVKTVQTKGKYCDVHEALDSEAALYRPK